MLETTVYNRDSIAANLLLLMTGELSDILRNGNQESIAKTIKQVREAKENVGYSLEALEKRYQAIYGEAVK